jgi:hypothetical protein
LQATPHRKPCKLFLQGKCPYGERCWDSHGKKAIDNPAKRTYTSSAPYKVNDYYTETKPYSEYSHAPLAKTGRVQPVERYNYQKEVEEFFNEMAQVDTSELNEQVKRIYADMKRVNLLRNHTFAKRSLDLMFIIDCTASMGTWIEACKKEMRNIIDFVLN